LVAPRQLGWALVVAVVALGACGGKSGPAPNVGAGVDGGATCSDDGGARKALGQACGCGGDCQSGFCADGVCCNTACADTCKACNTTQAPGTCAFVANGLPPRAAGVCPTADVTTCGLDGLCNGAGACRKYAPGTVCKAGACAGASVAGVDVCDGGGRCKPGPATVCAPYDCDATTNKCFPTCASDADCANGVKCVAGSCGPKPRGAVCANNVDCASGFCADGVCCNVACTGACVSCAQVGREGTCWPTDQGVTDPHKVCVAQAASTCGRTGTCDGFGGCALVQAETICVAPSCAGDRLNTAGTCNGVGVCLAPGVQTCEPFRCASGACETKCTTDADCETGHACVAGSCGPRQNGQLCAKAGDCASGFCVDGVCCADACLGACKSCALPSSMGRCAPIPAGGGDARGQCVDHGAASCGTDGFCDGAGACRKYAVGTACAAEHCESNVYTPGATCNTTGQCAAPATIGCAPYACNGARCWGSCTADAACVAPNTCDANNSCGKKPTGAFCSDKSECVSGACAQGVCCAADCSGPCRSCALTGSMGLCRDVPPGAPDPAGTCAAQTMSTCGTNGMCEAGACQKYAQGVPCADASCPTTMPGTTFTPGSTCDGAGTCVTPTASSCFPFRCGGSACKATCTADADCVAPAVCTNGSCGLKSPGAACALGAECASGTCAQGVCCKTACTGTCLSCALAATAGTCAPVPGGGADPTGTCANAGAASCGTTGFCDGAGACQLFGAGTSCAPPACPAGATTQTLGRTCDGAGTCKPAGTQSCAPYACNGTTCNTTCLADTDCASPDICDLTVNRCGNKKRLGQPCAADGDCLTNDACVDGVCCATATCGTCQACNIAGLEGTCNAVAAGGSEPHAECTPSPPCGFVGTCDGAGACRNAPVTTSCGTATCSMSTLTPTGFCTGAGACKQTPQSCGAYMCGADAACLTTCTGDGDCAAGDSCASGSCTNLLTNGKACTMGSDCVSGHCVEQVCCGSPSCPSCTSCAVPGKEGACVKVAPGGNDPLAMCMPMMASTCGTTGTCDGNGMCALYATGTVCLPGTCPAGGSATTAPSKCDGAGTCVAGATGDCTPYACGAGGTCNQAPCAGAPDCAAGHACDPDSSTCQ
jgi:hypothetical protein